jgi:hypothetical protein
MKLLKSGHRPLVCGIAVFLMAFGIFSLTTSQLTGYEPETAAATAGLVEEGHFWGVEDPQLPSLVAEDIGRDGHKYARTGLLQPVLQVPFFALGDLVDHQVSEGTPYPNRLFFLWFYNPFVAALGAAALFAFVYQLRRSLRWGAAIASLFVFASIAWPYSKIGMETTFMATVLVAFAVAAWARRRPSPTSFAVAGLAAGAIAATKPYSMIALVPVAIFLLPSWLALDRRERWRTLMAAVIPLLLWAIAIGWYNWLRFESPTSFGYSEGALTLSAPLNFLGLLASPGKGLIFYSPLVVLGALGLPKLWREDRWTVISLTLLLVLMIGVSGATRYWGDEVWGPRFLVSAAWTFLVPIAWWCDTAVRKKILIGFTVLAVGVQLVGAGAYYGRTVPIQQQLGGVPIYTARYVGVDPETIPYGDDPPRWIPQLSPLLLQTEGLISSQILERVGAGALTATYDPFEGPVHSVDFSNPAFRISPDFFWHELVPTTAARILALVFFLVAVAGGWVVYVCARLSRARPPGGPVPR